jgi:hypothetical protein
MQAVDLHAHSRISDGLLTPRELVRHACAQGVRVLALTDHDDVAGIAEAREEAALWGIHLVSGVEISVTWRGRTVHIVGLRIDEADSTLNAGLAQLRASRLARARRIAEELDRIGIHGSLEAAAAVSGQVISRSHFARFLVERGYAADVRSVFRHYLVRGKPGYVEHTWASLEDAVGWIHGAGGLAVIAHPGRYDLTPVEVHELFTEFRDLGGEGIEVVSGSQRPAEQERFARLVREFGFFASRGSDYHGPGHNEVDMGRLPALPEGLPPIWQDWPEVLLAAA